MFSIQLFLHITAAPRAVTAIETVVIAMAMPESTTERAIDAASRRNGGIFIAYIVVLIVTAVIVALFTWLTWDSGNRLQDAIRADADARIQEAKRGVEQLEKSNLILSSRLATLQGEAAKQEERAARAEASLLRLQDRRISPQQIAELVGLLKDAPNGPIEIIISADVGDANILATQIHDALHEAGWTRVPIRLAVSTNLVGLRIAVHDLKAVPPYISPLLRAFARIGLPVGVSEEPSFPPELVELQIGHKPSK